MSRRVIIAGGGTGGHVFPALAIGQALVRLDDRVELLFVGAKGKMEMEKIPAAGFPVVGLDIAGLNRSSPLKNIGLPWKLIKSVFQAGSLLRRFRPEVVVGVGGYASFPMLRAAQRKGIPTLIQEQNSFAGRSNKLLAPGTKTFCVAFDGMEKFFPPDRIVITGNPVRHAIAVSKVTRSEGIGFFQLDPNRKVILAVGGSLGAKSINEALAAGLDRIVDQGYQLIWQTGKIFEGRAMNVVAGRKGVWASSFITHMEMAYAAADVVVARAGSTIAELCIAAKPSIFVPYPYAAEDHQTSNAMNLVRHKAGLMIKDNEASSTLIDALLGLAADKELQQTLRDNIARLAIPDADERIAKEVLKLMV